MMGDIDRPLAVGLIAEASGLSWARAVLVVVPVAVLPGSAGAGPAAADPALE